MKIVAKRSTATPRRAGSGTLPLIGWREWLSVPSLGIGRIKAKVDTGARTSAIHAFKVRKTTDRGAPHVSFVVHPEQKARRPAIDCFAEILDERMITSSNGQRERRIVICTEIALGGQAWPIELTLADRDAMSFRMLLGREALRGRFLVDPAKSFVTGHIAPALPAALALKGYKS